MLNKQFVILMYLTINFNIVLCNHHLEETEQVNQRSHVFQLLNDNSSYILPTDDKICNWGDRIENSASEFQNKDKLVYRHLHINKIAKYQTIYKFEKHICADKIITEVRLINVGRQRGFVKCLDIKRATINEDVIRAEIVAKANEQFRIWIEIYAYDSARGLFHSWTFLMLISLLGSIHVFI